MNPKDLIEVRRNTSFQAPVMLVHLSGATDAGNAGGMAVDQLLASLPSQRVAEFDTDLLIDYRSHRPSATLENWSLLDMEVPEIAVDLVQDDQGTPILVLHGPEPDMKWQRFGAAVADFAHEAGVELAVSLMGMPAGVPHTRPTVVHLQSTDPSLVADQPSMEGQIQVSSSVNTFLQHVLREQGTQSLNFLAAVPYYVARMDYPQASLALLDRMGEKLGLSLPTGNIEAGNQFVGAQLAHLIDENEEVTGFIHMLEEQFDETVQPDPAAKPQLPYVPGEGRKAERMDADALAQTIEAFLARSEGISVERSPESQASTQPRPRHRAPGKTEHSPQEDADE
ncbi:PAC2 family protein [Gleimia hominis]|uniref:PAC2 family protein n=1 Tax=Gleimia hominis TaxID=595468 RepID=UPI000C80CD81|nr:PAC2 family protein [Gleimia hominis]WIK64963.1 PAC2 family protein [Gleimia hominis]